MNTLLESARYYNRIFGFNVVPARGKRPAVEWVNWQLIEQTPREIAQLGWGAGISGIAGICGFNQFRCFNFNNVSDPRIIQTFCTHLRLPKEYRWTVKSGTGFHIWIKVRDCPALEKKLHGPKKIYRLFFTRPGLCDYIELRWSGSQTLLPYSIDKEGNRYSFLYNDPLRGPASVNPERVIECIEDFCDLSRETQILHKGKLAFEPEGYDLEKLDSAINFLMKHLPSDSIRERNLIAGGLVSIGETGRESFLRLCLGNKKCGETSYEINSRFDSMRKISGGKATIETVFRIASKYGWEKPPVIFWNKDAEGLSILQHAFLKFLSENGFCKLETGNCYMLLNVKNNIVRQIEIFGIKDFAINYIKTFDDDFFKGVTRAEIKNAMIKNASRFFSHTYLEFIETRKFEFLRDSKDKGFLFFENCFVEITGTSLSARKYGELEGYIWEKQIIPRPYKHDYKESEFARFIANVCKNNEKRILSLRSAIGYLLHNFKDSANAKAIIFLDEKLAEGAYGRSGKGVVAQAIGKLRKTVRLDGRNFNFSKNFSFQSVTLDTAVIEFNDASKKFNFDKLFSIITDDITVEKKNKDEIIIPFRQSPKIIISTNYTIEGSDDSTLDRQFTVEFSDHYNKSHRPIDEFGHRFFDEWNNAEWNAFFNYMIGCMQLYLKKGLIECGFVNLKRKKLIDATCAEFAEFLDSFPFGIEQNKKEVLERFKKEYEDFTDLKIYRFTHWLKEATKILGYTYNERKSGNERYVTLGIRQSDDN